MTSKTSATATGLSVARITWLDQAKGIGLLIVMLGHAPTPDLLARWVYSFHVPFFFFLSGFVYNSAKYVNLRVLLKAKVRSLLVPYLFFSAIGLAYFFAQHPTGRHLHYTPFKVLLGTALGIRDTSPFNGTLWFLTCLFSTTLFYSLVLRLAKGRRHVAVVFSLGFSILGILLFPAIRTNPRLPFSFDVGIVMAFFFALGAFARPLLPSKVGFRWWAPALVVQFAALWFNSSTNIYFFQFGTIGLFFLHSTAGIVVATGLIQHLPSIRLVRSIGENSITFLALHQFYLYPLLAGLLSRLGPTSLDGGIVPLLIAGLFVLVSTLIILPIALFLKRRAPSLVGA